MISPLNRALEMRIVLFLSHVMDIQGHLKDVLACFLAPTLLLDARSTMYNNTEH